MELNARAETLAAFSDCSPKTTSKGYDVFDTPALALSHPLHGLDGADEEKGSQSASDVVEETRQEAEVKKSSDTVPPRIPQAKVQSHTIFGPTGNYHLSPLFERSFIDLGRLMVEEGFDLVTYTQLQSLLSDDWKFV